MRIAASILASLASLLLASSAADAEAKPAEAKAAETGSDDATTPASSSGARVQVGALVVGHVRRVTAAGDKEPGTLAPGGVASVVWRVEGWELGPTLRAAHFEEPHFMSLRKTTLLSAGGRARWFAFASSSVTPFVDVGVDLLAFRVDSTHNFGPSAHGGLGLEVFHRDAHHRLRFDLGVDVPTFALDEGDTRAETFCAGCGRSSATERIYIVPATLAATWTF